MKITGFHPANKLAKLAVTELKRTNDSDLSNVDCHQLCVDARRIGCGMKDHPIGITINIKPGYVITNVHYM